MKHNISDIWLMHFQEISTYFLLYTNIVIIVFERVFAVDDLSYVQPRGSLSNIWWNILRKYLAAKTI